MEYFKKNFIGRNLMDWVEDSELKEIFGVSSEGAVRLRNYITAFDKNRYNNKPIDEDFLYEFKQYASSLIQTIEYTGFDMGYRDAKIINETGANSKVYMGMKIDGKKVVVKEAVLLWNNDQMKMDQKVGLIFEAIITKIMHKISKEIPNFHSPDIYSCSRTMDYKSVLILEEVPGKSLYTHKDEMKSIETLANIIQLLQQTVNFSHRDLHGYNVMWDGTSISIIDYGMACISMPYNRDMSVQDISGWYKYKLKYDNYPNNLSKALRSCNNKSHDMCMIILALARKTTDETLKRWAKQITIGYIKKMRSGYNKYTVARLVYLNRYDRKDMRSFFFPDIPLYTKFLDKPSSMTAEQIYDDLQDGKRQKNLPWAFIYQLYEIELEEFTPENILKKINDNFLAGFGDLKF